MPSDKQLTANRLNSQKSTGPRTGAGKSRSSANALKTGIYSQALIIKGESQTDLDALTAEYYAEHHPATPTGRALVNTLIHNEWLLRRLRRVETDTWNQGIEFLEDSEYQPKNHLLADTFANKDDKFLLLQRRIDSLDRAWHRALKALRQLQADPPRTPVDESAADTPEALAPQQFQSPIGFVPSPALDTPLETPSISLLALSRHPQTPAPPSFGSRKTEIRVTSAN
jgi:hypothetical protein